MKAQKEEDDPVRLKCGLASESYKQVYGEDSLAGEKEVFNNSSLSLTTARRDWAAFQVLLRSEDDMTVTVGNNPYFSPRGRIPNIRLAVKGGEHPGWAVRMYPVHLMEDDDRLFKADKLLHQETVFVPAGKTQSIWVEMEIPEDCPPGFYHGQVVLYGHVMFEEEKILATLDWQLEVKDVLLPRPEEFRFHLDLWQHPSNIARKHEVPLWSDEHFRVLEEYVKSLRALGQKAITVVASEIPWSGQSCFQTKNYLSDLFEYNMARVVKEKNRFVYDFSVIERYVKLCFRYGIDREIEVFGLINIWTVPDEGYDAPAADYPDALRIRYYDCSDGCYKYMTRAEEIKEYIKALESFFVAKGWSEKVRVVADEPADLELYRKRLRLLQEIAPSFKFKTAINHVEFIEEFKDVVTDYVLYLGCLCREWEKLDDIKKRLAGRLLWYVCCVPQRPNTFLASPLLECQLIPVLTAYMGFDGFLRWNYTAWPEHPRRKIFYRYPVWKAGDTNFVYPAADGRPLLSLRYKNLKRGIENFELLSRLLEEAPDKSYIWEKLKETILKAKTIKEFDPDANKEARELYSLEDKDYQLFRKWLLEEVEKLGAGKRG